MEGQEQKQEQGNQQDASKQQGNQQQEKQAKEPLNFDKWYGSLDDATRDLFNDHVDGLKSALTSERNERKKLAAQIKELSGKADKGSELAQQLEQLTGNMGKLDQKAQFYEDAHSADVANLKLAWVAAQEFDLLGKDDKVDFNKLREAAPELFRKKVTPPANAGNGNNQAGTTQPTMNSFIRRAAGR